MIIRNYGYRRNHIRIEIQGQILEFFTQAANRRGLSKLILLTIFHSAKNFKICSIRNFHPL